MLPTVSITKFSKLYQAHNFQRSWLQVVAACILHSRPQKKIIFSEVPQKKKKKKKKLHS